MDVQYLLYSFFRFYVFVNEKRTVIARKLIFFRKYRYFNSLSNATHSIQIHRAVLEKLRFEKKVKKILTSNIWNLWTNHFAQRTWPRTIQYLPPQGILKRWRQFYSRNRWMYKTHFNHISGGYVFVNKKRTVIARKLFFFEKI